MTEDGNIQDIIARIRSGDKMAKEKFFHANTGLIWACARKYSGLCEKDDLFQLGAIGLLKAIDRFDPSYGVAFSTYAFPMIMGEMRRYLRDQGPIKVGRHMKEVGLLARKISEKKTRDEGKEPSAKEIAEELGISLDFLVTCLDATSPLLYLDDVSPLSDIGVSEARTKEASLSESLDLRMALEKLDKREKYIIEGRFFLEKTQSEISSEIGISQAQISRLEKEALLKLRAWLSPSGEFNWETGGNTTERNKVKKGDQGLCPS